MVSVTKKPLVVHVRARFDDHGGHIVPYFYLPALEKSINSYFLLSSLIIFVRRFKDEYGAGVSVLCWF